MITLSPPLLYTMPRWTLKGMIRNEVMSWDDLSFNQGFGENKLDLYKKWGMKGHNGYDYGAVDGDPIVASHDGIVLYLEKDESAGLGVILWDKTYKTISWHMKEILVEKGQKIKRRQLLGYANNTGYSTGTHLHYGLKLTNDKGETLNKGNGYFGAIPIDDYIIDNMKLTKGQVRRLNALWGVNRDEEAEAYWEGRKLDELLKARIEDEIKELKAL